MNPEPAVEFQGQSFRRYARLLRDLHRLDRLGKSESDEADLIRDRMDAPYKRLSANEIEYLKSLSQRLYANGEQKSPEGYSRDCLSSGVWIVGSVKFTGKLFVNGVVEGEIVSDGVLILGENADVLGNVRCRAAEIHGAVEGSIIAVDRCELKSTAVLFGDVRTNRLVMSEGAMFVGRSEATSGRTAPPPSSRQSGSGAASGTVEQIARRSAAA